MSKESTKVGANVRETKPELSFKDPTSSLSPVRLERMFEVEQNHRKDKIEKAMHDMHNSSISDLLRMTKIQMIESEMEKKHECELLYHMTRQKLEMCQLRKELGKLSGIKNNSRSSTSAHGSYGLTHHSLNFKPAQMKRGDLAFETAGAWGRDNAFDGITHCGDSNEDWEVLKMAGKIPDFPETPENGPIKAPWSDDTGQRPAYFKNEEFERDALHLQNFNENGRIRHNFLNDFMRKSCKSMSSACIEENTHSKFNTELFKTEICRRWSEFGMCPYGNNCRYAHGFAELRVKPKPHWKYKTERCKKFLNGYCPYGSRCCFVHKLNEYQSPGGRGLRGEAHSNQRTVMTQRWHGQSTPMHPSKMSQFPEAHE